MRNAEITLVICGVMLAAVSVAAGLLAAATGRKIGDPIKKCTERILLLSEGDITSDVPKIRSNDETLLLANATETVVGSLNSIINDIGRILEK